MVGVSPLFPNNLQKLSVVSRPLDVSALNFSFSAANLLGIFDKD